MKKSKLLILLPLIALSMSSCDMSLVAGQSGSNNRSSSSEEVNEPSSYSSYLVEYGLYYQGNRESVPEGASLYLYGSLVRDSFTPLTVNEEGNYQTTIYDIEYGTYEYSLYIEYTDKEVSLESPLVYSGLETVNGNSSSGGNKYIFLDSSLNALLGEEQDEGSGGEDITYTYTIEVDNTEALTTLTYDGNSQTQTSVDLQVYLVTTPSEGNPERIPASETDVELSNYAETIISVSGLTVTPVGPGTTSITISKEGYQSAYVEVSVSDITITGNTNQITLYFTFTYETTTQTIPDDAKVFICGNWDDATWSETNVPTLQYDDTNECYYAVITYDGNEDVMNSHWYTYNLYLAGINDSFSYDNNVKLSTDNLWWSASDYTDPTYTKSETIILSDTFDNLLNESLGGDGDTEDQDPYTYISNYTLEITIMDTNGNAKKCAEGYSLWIGSGLNGSWNTAYNGYWDWGDTVKLNETVSGDSITYTYTYDHVAIGATYDYNILYSTATESGSLDWGDATEGTTGDKLGSDNFTFTVTGTSDSYTESITCTATTSLVDSMLNVSASSGDTGTGGDDKGEGGDTGSGTTPINNYKIVFTIYDTNGAVQQCPSYGSLYLHGNFGGDLITSGDGDPYYEWSDQYIKLDETTYNSHVAYSTTFSGVIPGETYAFDICFIYGEEDTSTWRPINPADANEKYDFYCTIDSNAQDGGTQYQDLTGCYTLASEFASSESEDEGLKPDATYVSNYTLTITLYDSDGHMKQCPSGGSLYMASGLNGSWNTAYDGYWDWGDPVPLNENVTSDGVTYSYTYDSAVEGETYSYNLYYVESGATFDWNNGKLGDTDFSFTVDSGISDGHSQSIVCTATSDVISSFDTVSGYDVEGYTLVFTIYDTSNNVQKCPDWGYLSLQGDFETGAGGSWGGYNDMTETVDQNGNTAYSVHYNTIVDGTGTTTHSFNIMFTYTGESVSWTPIRTDGNFSCTIAADAQPGTYYFDATGSNDIATSFPSHEGATECNVYLCIVDTSNTSASSINSIYAGSDDNIFVNNGYDDHSWDNVTTGTTTYNSNTTYAAYQASSLVMYANDSHWANFHGDKSDQNYYFEFNVPSDLGTDVCFVVFADCSAFVSYSANTYTAFSIEVTGTWYAGTPTTIFATGFTA